LHHLANITIVAADIGLLLLLLIKVSSQHNEVLPMSRVSSGTGAEIERGPAERGCSEEASPWFHPTKFKLDLRRDVDTTGPFKYINREFHVNRIWNALQASPTSQCWSGQQLRVVGSNLATCKPQLYSTHHMFIIYSNYLPSLTPSHSHAPFTLTLSSAVGSQLISPRKRIWSSRHFSDFSEQLQLPSLAVQHS